MHTMSDLLASAERMNAQVKNLADSGKYSEEYLGDLRAKNRADLTKMRDDAYAEARTLAATMMSDAKASYLLASVDTLDERDRDLFRTFAGAATTAELEETVKRPAGLSDEKLLILGAELRRRGNDVWADTLAQVHPPVAEPWKQSEAWQKALTLLADFEVADIAGRVLESTFGAGTHPGPYLLSDGEAKSVDEILL